MRHQLGGRSAKELCKDSIIAARKGSYLDAWDLAMMCVQAANFGQLPPAGSELLDRWRDDPDTIWAQYFGNEDAPGWPFWCLHNLADTAPTAAWALRAHQRWAESAFVQVLHPTYHARAQTEEKPWLSIYENYDSRTKLAVLHANLADGAPFDETVRLFRELQQNEPNFPKGVLPQTGAVPADAAEQMRSTVDAERARIRFRPEDLMHPTGCFTAPYVLRRIDLALPSSAFNITNWLAQWGDRNDVIQHLTDAIAQAHHGNWSFGMRHLDQFFALASTGVIADDVFCDPVVGEICWKMVGFSRTVLQGIEVVEIIAEKRLPFVCPIY